MAQDIMETSDCQEPNPCVAHSSAPEFELRYIRSVLTPPYYFTNDPVLTVAAATGAGIKSFIDASILENFLTRRFTDDMALERGLCALYTGNFGLAKELLGCAKVSYTTSHQVDNPEVILAYMLTLFLSKDYIGALDTFMNSNFSAVAPGPLQCIHAVRGMCLVHLQQHELAATILRRCLTEQCLNSAYKELIVFHLVLCSESCGQEQSAIPLLDSVLRHRTARNRSNGFMKSVRHEILLRWLRLLHSYPQHGANCTHISLFEVAEEAICLSPTASYDWYCLARLYESRSLFPQAILAVSCALHMDSNVSQHWHFLGFCLSQNDNTFLHSSRALKCSLQLDPNDTMSLLQLADMYAFDSNRTEAGKCYLRAAQQMEAGEAQCRFHSLGISMLQSAGNSKASGTHVLSPLEEYEQDGAQFLYQCSEQLSMWALQFGVDDATVSLSTDTTKPPECRLEAIRNCAVSPSSHGCENISAAQTFSEHTQQAPMRRVCNDNISRTVAGHKHDDGRSILQNACAMDSTAHSLLPDMSQHVRAADNNPPILETDALTGDVTPSTAAALKVHGCGDRVVDTACTIEHVPDMLANELIESEPLPPEVEPTVTAERGTIALGATYATPLHTQAYKVVSRAVPTRGVVPADAAEAPSAVPVQTDQTLSFTATSTDSECTVTTPVEAAMQGSVECERLCTEATVHWAAKETAAVDGLLFLQVNSMQELRAQTTKSIVYDTPRPMILIRGALEAVGVNPAMFTPKAIADQAGDTVVDVRKQRVQEAEANVVSGNKPSWVCESFSVNPPMTIRQYVDYLQTHEPAMHVVDPRFVADPTQRRARTTMVPSCESVNTQVVMGVTPAHLPPRNSTVALDVRDAALSNTDKFSLFCTNVDLLDSKMWKPQLDELKKLPHFLRVNAAKDLLTKVSTRILGMNTVQMYLKATGSRTPTHQENNNFVSVNISFGPSQCVWYFIDAKYFGALDKLCQQRKINFTTDSWWPNLNDLEDAGIPFQFVVQEPGDLIYVNIGTIHWVQSLGCCTNVAWNLGPPTLRQLEAAWHRYDHYMKPKRIRSLVPMKRLISTLTKSKGYSNRDLNIKIHALMTKIATENAEVVAEVKKHKSIRIVPCGNKGVQCCSVCNDELFNLIFMLEDTSGVFFCWPCMKQRGLAGAIALQQVCSLFFQMCFCGVRVWKCKCCTVDYINLS
eukprot:m.1544133 g.1544133  ORF g.1544133 m.1544133 type:complete len:1191 (-) comp25256_c0_seq59:2620-6192(-)